MSMRSVLRLTIFAVFVVTLEAQTTPNATPEPQYINSFSVLDPAGKLIELEHETVAFHTKTKVLPGYASVKMVAEFKPGRSSVRVPSNAVFVVRGYGHVAAVNPATLYELRLLKSSKDKREIAITQGHGTMFGGGATSSMDEGAIPIRFEEYGSSSYRIVPQHPLSPGEYALTMKSTFSDLYCLGVDQ